MSYYSYANNNNNQKNSLNQWYVSLSVDGAAVPSSDSTNDDSSLSDGAIAGIVIGTLAGVAVLAAAGFFIFRKYGQPKEDKKTMLERLI